MLRSSSSWPQPSTCPGLLTPTSLPTITRALFRGEIAYAALPRRAWPMANRVSAETPCHRIPMGMAIENERTLACIVSVAAWSSRAKFADEIRPERRRCSGRSSGKIEDDLHRYTHRCLDCHFIAFGALHDLTK